MTDNVDRRRCDPKGSATAPTTGSPGRPSRRRIMTLLGAVAGLPLLGAGDHAVEAEAVPLHRWSGTSLGSPSRLLLYHRDRTAAARIAGYCAAEIARLERIFALYRGDSELARLNRDGCLDAPSFDLLTLLSHCQRLSALSDGAFDVTVQPLWNLYAGHFFAGPYPPPEGPAPRAIDQARRLVDFRSIDVAARRIVLARPGMGLTLNGIAQGYVADRVTEILRDNGCDCTLADLGRSEIKTQGRRTDGHPWRIALADPRQPDRFAAEIELRDRAVCTSGGYGTMFEPTGRYHHLFDPATGGSANHYIGISVIAASAMIADALSTALYVSPPERGPALLASFPGVSVRLTRPDGTVELRRS
ncbi:MAG: FAD:protein FMN transferase [Stellaceae bacterium]